MESIFHERVSEGPGEGFAPSGGRPAGRRSGDRGVGWPSGPGVLSLMEQSGQRPGLPSLCWPRGSPRSPRGTLGLVPCPAGPRCPSPASFRWQEEAAARFPLPQGRAGAFSRGDAGACGPAQLGSARPASSAGKGNVVTGDQRASGLSLSVSSCTAIALLGPLEIDFKYGKVQATAACVS